MSLLGVTGILERVKEKEVVGWGGGVEFLGLTGILERVREKEVVGGGGRISWGNWDPRESEREGSGGGGG